jgi:hypothetical protein
MVGLGFILSGKVLSLVLKNFPSWRWLRMVGIAIWSLSALLLVVDAMEASHSLYSAEGHVLIELLLLIVLIACVWAGIYFFANRQRSRTWSFIKQVSTVVVLLLLMGWCYARIDARSSGHLTYGLASSVPGNIELDDRFLCETDIGSDIQVFRFSTADSAFLRFCDTFRLRYAHFGNSLIRRGAADQHTNCHGWVFTGGKFLLRGEGVERILTDHDYHIVETPVEGDIVIYRAQNGSILHTALVQAVLNDGTVITESKWGVEQRFLHLPDDQPYSNIYNYYRTTRPNHLVKIRSVKEKTSTLENSQVSRQGLTDDNG